MIEAFLLTVFVGAIVLLMHTLSSPAKSGDKRILGLFAYTEDASAAAEVNVKKAD